MDHSVDTKLKILYVLEITNKLLISGLLYDHLISLAHESQEMSTQCLFTCTTRRLRLSSGLLTVNIGLLYNEDKEMCTFEFEYQQIYIYYI